MRYYLQYLKSIDKFLMGIIAIMAFISILMITSISYDNGFVLSRDIIIQSLSYAMGFIAILIIVGFDYNNFYSMDKVLYIVTVVFLLLVYVPGLGVSQFGAQSWIDLGFTTLQPSEFAKISFVLIMASYLDKNKHTLYNFRGLAKAGLIALPIILIVLKEDLGSALVFAAIWATMIFYAGVNGKVFAKLMAVVMLLVPFAYFFLAEYQKERILAFIHPNNLSLSGNYQVWQSKAAIGSGGFTGKGLFQGTQKAMDFIPVQNSDFIFSVIAEELGMIGGCFVILLFAVLLVKLAQIARDASNFFGGIIVMGFLGLFLFQTFENIAMAMGIMPVTGITLPFLSYGGSSILSNMLSIGIIMSVFVRSKSLRF